MNKEFRLFPEGYPPVTVPAETPEDAAKVLRKQFKEAGEPLPRILKTKLVKG